MEIILIEALVILALSILVLSLKATHLALDLIERLKANKYIELIGQ